MENSRQASAASVHNEVRELQSNFSPRTPEYHRKPRSTRDQRARRFNKIEKPRKSAKPPPPVQIRAAPPNFFEELIVCASVAQPPAQLMKTWLVARIATPASRPHGCTGSIWSSRSCRRHEKMRQSTRTQLECERIGERTILVSLLGQRQRVAVPTKNSIRPACSIVVRCSTRRWRRLGRRTRREIPPIAVEPTHVANGGNTSPRGRAELDADDGESVLCRASFVVVVQAAKVRNCHDLAVCGFTVRARRNGSSDRRIFVERQVSTKS